MIAQLFVLLAVFVAAMAQAPPLPTMPAQYKVTNVNMVMDTNAGYPPHYTETDSAEYYDFPALMTRTDVLTASYGTKGPYTRIYNYNELFTVNCGGMYDNMQAPRAYQIANGKCCYTPLVSDCPYKPVGNNPIPSVDTMYAPALPKKIAYEGVVDAANCAALPAGTTANEWQSLIMAGQPVPVIETDYYFSTTDPAIQLGNYLHVVLGPQFVNATTVYDGQWTFGPQDASLFDVSAYDCSKECSSSVSDHIRYTNKHKAHKVVEA